MEQIPRLVLRTDVQFSKTLSLEKTFSSLGKSGSMES